MATLDNQQNYTVHVLLKFCIISSFSDCHKDITTIILLGSLISPLTPDTEQPFSSIKLIYTQLGNRLPTKNSSHCMRICKYIDLSAGKYEQILGLSLVAEEIKNE